MMVSSSLVLSLKSCVKKNTKWCHVWKLQPQEPMLLLHGGFPRCVIGIAPDAEPNRVMLTPQAATSFAHAANRAVEWHASNLHVYQPTHSGGHAQTHGAGHAYYSIVQNSSAVPMQQPPANGELEIYWSPLTVQDALPATAE